MSEYIPPFYIETDRDGNGVYVRLGDTAYATLEEAEDAGIMVYCKTKDDTRVVDSVGNAVSGYGVFYPCPGDPYGDPFYVSED